MRKWTALLLAVLLAVTPVCAPAEGYRIETLFDVDGKALAPALTELLSIASEAAGQDLLAATDGMNVQDVAEMVELLMDAAAFTLQMQEDGLRVECLMQGKSLLTAQARWTAEEIRLCTSLLPDVELLLPLAAFTEGAEALDAVDWTALLSDLTARTFRWASALPVTEKRGSFGGDAYQGGERRVSYTVTDANFAALADSLLLSVEGNEPLVELLQTLFGEKELAAAFRSFREYSVDVALTSAYHYEFSRVFDENDVNIGLSLNVMEADELVATVSLGTDAAGEKVTLVAGIPLGGGVVYVDAHGAFGSETSFSFGVYQCPTLMSYQQAAQDAGVLVQRQTVTVKEQQADNGYIREINSVYTGDLDQRTQTLQIVVNEPYSLTQTATTWLADGASPVSVVTTTVGEAAEALAFPEGAAVIDVTRAMEDPALMEAMDASIEKGVQNLTILLLQTLPPSLLTMLVQMQ